MTAAQRARRATQLESPLESPSPDDAPSAGTAGRPAALSFAQERIWFFSQLDRDSPVYNVPVALRWTGPLDPEALRRALEAVVRRHQILRTRYPAEAGVPAQVADPPCNITLHTTDLAAEPGPRREAALRAALAAEARRPFDLERGPVLRARLFRLGERSHALLVVKHHIATDGWSENLFLTELLERYRVFAGGGGAPSAELPLQYADFAEWQRVRLRGPAFERSLAYWVARLDGVPEPMELPTDRPRPSRRSLRGGVARRRLRPELVQALQSLGRGQGATWFMTLCAAFQTFLHRYSGLSDFVVGTPAAGRTRTEAEALLGAFINTLPLRADFSGRPVFLEVLRRVRESVLGALGHQDVPFERIVEALRPARSASHQPIVQVMFIFLPAPFRLDPPPGVSLVAETLDTGTSKFDLTLLVEETADGWTAGFEYAADLFDAATVEGMLDGFCRLLESVRETPGRPVADLTLLDPGERRRVMLEWNRTETAFERDRLLPDVLADQARRTPDAAAIRWLDRTLSYRELHRRADVLAERLRAGGAGPGMRVALCAERSAAMVVGLLGIARSGAAYVPLDPAYPKDRVRFMLEDSRASLLVAQAELRAAVGASGVARVLELDADGRLAAEAAPGAKGFSPGAVAPAAPQDPVYVIYTSGSTGRPKGVVVTHRNVLNFFAGMDALLGPEPGVWLALASICFDPSVLELWWALARGFAVTIASEDEKRTEQLAGLIGSHGVTHLQCTPSLARVLVALPEVRASLRSVRKLLVGGEALPRALARELAAAIGGQLYNVYGPTEATVWALARRVGPEDLQASGAEGPRGCVPIGRPLANVQAHILDGRLEPVPVGVPGEIHLGGEGVAVGYFGQPQLTAQRFVADPFRPGGRLYRTGDLGRQRADGTIEFLGRSDFQVKLRGHRIELEEIEAALLEHPGVHACAAVLREDRPGDARLVAYVVPKPNLPGRAAEWRSHLEAKLPAYMVPADFVVLPGLPLTPSGKVDRKALPSPEAGPAPAESEPAADELQQRLVPVWQAVLGGPIRPDDNFFARGGHSLLAVELAARLERALGRRVPVSAIYEAPSVERLARRLRAEEADFPPELAAIQPGGARRPLFLVHGIGSGMLWGYANLAACLGPGQPLYAFKSRAIDGGDECRTIEELAARYAAALVRFQPDGPYLIGGYCFGGIVAFEMACQLREQGRDVRLLALLNAYPQNSGFGRMRWRPRALAAFSRNLALIGGEFARGEVGDRTRYLKWKLRRLRQRLGAAVGRCRDARVNPDAYVDMGGFPRELWPLLAAHATALRRHRHRVYAGPVALFRTRGYPPICSFEEDYGWSRFAPAGVSVRIIPGKHDTMLEEPHVGRLAEALMPFLD